VDRRGSTRPKHCLRDPGGDYQLARAEALPFPNASFDLVVSYLTLIDIANFRLALMEMARVLMPAGTLLIANLNSFIASCQRDVSKTSTDATYNIESIGIWKSLPSGGNGLASASRTGGAPSHRTCRNSSD
jgi:ubiquinone/menaquinone biosynthesis C-methylase UbiE